MSARRNTVRRPSPRLTLLALSGVAVVTIGVFTIAGLESAPRPRARSDAEAAQATPLSRIADEISPVTLDELLALPSEQLGRVDLARMNLLCASGLPGAEGIDIEAVLAQIDAWARRVRHETDRHLYRLADPAFAPLYQHSEPYFRASFMLQTLQEDCGVRYDPEAILDPDFTDSRDQFIHGLMDPAHGGTCASMPVLYAAVGRRLGYPIRLVTTRGHLFCRWDDGRGTHLNIEGSGEGFSSFPDEHYRNWPYQLTESDLEPREYLVSYTPAEELATFLAARGHCLMALERYPEALDAYRAVVRVAPTFKEHADFVAMAEAGVRGGIEAVEREYGRAPEQAAAQPP